MAPSFRLNKDQFNNKNHNSNKIHLKCLIRLLNLYKINNLGGNNLCRLKMKINCGVTLILILGSQNK